MLDYALLEDVQRPFKVWPSTQSSSVTVVSPTEVQDELTSLAAGVQDLRGIVELIVSRSPLQLSAETEELINRAALAHGTPENLETWSRTLAEDVRDLTD